MAAKDEEGAFTTHHTFTRTYGRDEGSVALPCGNGEVEIVDLFDPVETVIDSFVARRIGGPPVVPAPISNDRNLRLLHSAISPCAPVLGASQNIKHYEISGTYIYAAKTAKGFNRDLPTGKSPMDAAALDNNAIPAKCFVQGLAGSGGSQITGQTFTKGTTGS